jgi:hypothetical protein
MDGKSFKCNSGHASNVAYGEIQWAFVKMRSISPAVAFEDKVNEEPVTISYLGLGIRWKCASHLPMSCLPLVAFCGLSQTYWYWCWWVDVIYHCCRQQRYSIQKRICHSQEMTVRTVQLNSALFSMLIVGILMSSQIPGSAPLPCWW